MSDGSTVANSLRERFGGTTEERLGKALSELLESPLLTGAIGRMFDAREKAAQAQEVAMGALNIPSAADIERLTRRLRSVSFRLEGIEDGLARLDRGLAPGGVEARLSAIEEQLQALSRKIGQPPGPQSRSASPPTRAASAPSGRAAGARPARAASARGGSGAGAKGGSAAGPKDAATAKPRSRKAKPSTPAKARKSAPKRA